ERLLHRARDAGRETLEVAQHAVALGDADGNIGIKIAGPQNLDDRCQSDGLLYVAPRLYDADAVLGLDELGPQPALADAGIADDRDHPHCPCRHRAIERGRRARALGGPADEDAGVGGLRLAAEPLVRRHGRGPTLHLQLAEGVVPMSATRIPPRLLAD